MLPIFYRNFANMQFRPQIKYLHGQHLASAPSVSTWRQHLADSTGPAQYGLISARSSARPAFSRSLRDRSSGVRHRSSGVRRRWWAGGTSPRLPSRPPSWSAADGRGADGWWSPYPQARPSSFRTPNIGGNKHGPIQRSRTRTPRIQWGLYRE